MRWSVAGSLRDAGYDVVETASGEEAIAICGTKAPIDLLFTDINLLGLKTGWDVADCFRAHRPASAVLYTSAAEATPLAAFTGASFCPSLIS